MKCCFSWDERACFKRLTFVSITRFSDYVEIVGEGKLANRSCSALFCKAVGSCKLKREGTFWEETKLFNMCSCSKCYFCSCCSKQFCILHDSWQELIMVLLLFHLFKRRTLFLEFPVGAIAFSSSRVDFCLCHCLHDYLIPDWSCLGLSLLYSLGKQRHSWSYTSAPRTEHSWVPYITSCWLFSESFFGQRAGEA